MRRWVAPGLGVLSLLALAACATPGGGDAGPYRLTEERPDAGALTPHAFVMEKDGRTVTVFGTVHLTPERLQWMSATTETMLSGADLVLTETSITRLDEVLLSKTQTDDLSGAMLLPPGKTLWAIAGAKAQGIRDGLTAQGLSASAYTALRPWVACRDIQLPPGSSAAAMTDDDRRLIKDMTARFGAPDPVPPDLKVELFAVSNGIPAMFLESEYDRAANFSRLSDADAIDCAAKSAARALAPDAKRRMIDLYGELLDRWLSGDVEGARRWMEEDQSAINPAWMKLFLKGREDAWLSRIGQYCDAGKRNCFVAVGFAHLGGADGLLKGLQRMGYRLRHSEG